MLFDSETITPKPNVCHQSKAFGPIYTEIILTSVFDQNRKKNTDMGPKSQGTHIKSLKDGVGNNLAFTYCQ